MVAFYPDFVATVRVVSEDEFPMPVREFGAETFEEAFAWVSEVAEMVAPEASIEIYSFGRPIWGAFASHVQAGEAP